MLLNLLSCVFANPGVLDLDLHLNDVNHALRRRSAGLLEQKLYHESIEYYIDIEIGTPAQAMHLVLDSTIGDIVVMLPITDLCKKGGCNEGTIFNPDTSSTFSTNLVRYERADDGSFVEGYFGTDVFTIGGTQLSQKIQFATVLEATRASNAVAGLGLEISESDFENQDITQPYANLVTVLETSGAITHAGYSVFLNSREESEGKITFGGYDQSLVEGDMFRFPMVASLTQTLDYCIKLDGASLITPDGNKQQFLYSSLPILFNPANTLSSLPHVALQTLFDSLGAYEHKSTGAYVVPCETLENGGGMTLHFSGVDFDFAFKDIAYVFDTANNLCIPGFLPTSGSTDTPIIGQNFMQSLYTVYDNVREELSLAFINSEAASSPDIVNLDNLVAKKAPDYSQSSCNLHYRAVSVTWPGIANTDAPNTATVPTTLYNTDAITTLGTATAKGSVLVYNSHTTTTSTTTTKSTTSTSSTTTLIPTTTTRSTTSTSSTTTLIPTTTTRSTTSTSSTTTLIPTTTTRSTTSTSSTTTSLPTTTVRPTNVASSVSIKKSANSNIDVVVSASIKSLPLSSLVPISLSAEPLISSSASISTSYLSVVKPESSLIKGSSNNLQKSSVLSTTTSTKGSVSSILSFAVSSFVTKGHVSSDSPVIASSVSSNTECSQVSTSSSPAVLSSSFGKPTSSLKTSSSDNLNSVERSSSRFPTTDLSKSPSLLRSSQALYPNGTRSEATAAMSDIATQTTVSAPISSADNWRSTEVKKSVLTSSLKASMSELETAGSSETSAKVTSISTIPAISAVSTEKIVPSDNLSTKEVAPLSTTTASGAVDPVAISATSKSSAQTLVTTSSPILSRSISDISLSANSGSSVREVSATSNFGAYSGVTRASTNVASNETRLPGPTSGVTIMTSVSIKSSKSMASESVVTVTESKSSKNTNAHVNPTGDAVASSTDSMSCTPLIVKPTSTVSTPAVIHETSKLSASVNEVRSTSSGSTASLPAIDSDSSRASLVINPASSVSAPAVVYETSKQTSLVTESCSTSGPSTAVMPTEDSGSSRASLAMKSANTLSNPVVYETSKLTALVTESCSTSGESTATLPAINAGSSRASLVINPASSVSAPAVVYETSKFTALVTESCSTSSGNTAGLPTEHWSSSLAKLVSTEVSQTKQASHAANTVGSSSHLADSSKPPHIGSTAAVSSSTAILISTHAGLTGTSSSLTRPSSTASTAQSVASTQLTVGIANGGSVLAWSVTSLLAGILCLLF